MSTGAWIAVAAVAAATLFAGWRALHDGRFRAAPVASTDAGGTGGVTEPTPVISVVADTPWSDQLGERATLLQFSSAFCAPCRTTRTVLADVAGNHPGVTHLEIDAEKHLDLVRRLKIMRTPTTLVLDPHGNELGRAVGAPTRDQVLRSLELA